MLVCLWLFVSRAGALVSLVVFIAVLPCLLVFLRSLFTLLCHSLLGQLAGLCMGASVCASVCLAVRLCVLVGWSVCFWLCTCAVVVARLLHCLYVQCMLVCVLRCAFGDSSMTVSRVVPFIILPKALGMSVNNFVLCPRHQHYEGQQRPPAEYDDEQASCGLNSEGPSTSPVGRTHGGLQTTGGFLCWWIPMGTSSGRGVPFAYGSRVKRGANTLGTPKWSETVSWTLGEGSRRRFRYD